MTLERSSTMVAITTITRKPWKCAILLRISSRDTHLLFFSGDMEGIWQLLWYQPMLVIPVSITVPLQQASKTLPKAHTYHPFPVCYKASCDKHSFWLPHLLAAVGPGVLSINEIPLISYNDCELFWGVHSSFSYYWFSEYVKSLTASIEGSSK